MKQFVTLLIFILCNCMTSHAQNNYLDYLKQSKPGQGVVTVNQSKAIDELVNGKQVPNTANGNKVQTNPQDDKTKTTPQPQRNRNEALRKTTEPQHKGTDTQHKTTTEPQHKGTEPQHNVRPDSIKKNEPQQANKEGNHENNAAKAENKKEETDIPVVDMRKKVMRKSYKVTGYRVQVYAGGNSRNDRLQAEQTGNNIKMKFPDQPVYVHFYSPRWICRMGNYKTLGEAQKVLSKVRALGYRQACLVKGQITVQY